MPKIPFSVFELNRAKELGQFLIFRTDNIPAKLSNSKIEYDINHPLEKRWALVTKEIVPKSTNKDYIGQTEVMINYLKNEIFKNKSVLPSEYMEAISEFESQKEELDKLICSRDVYERESSAERLANLKITKLVRHSEDEILYDLEVYCQKNNTYLLQDTYDWTSSFDANRTEFTITGHFFENHTGVQWHKPWDKRDYVGACFSRTV